MTPIRVLLVLALALLLPALAARADAAADIRSVIERQIAAFRADDAATAFSFAAPVIRRKFGTPENFMEMVRIGYPAVYRPKAVDFRGLEGAGDRRIQDVYFLGADGVGAIGRYIMERQDDGSWKIAGVVMTRAPDLGA